MTPIGEPQGGQASSEPTRARGSIQGRMLLAIGAWSAVILLAAGWLLLTLYTAEIERKLDEDINATLETLTAAVVSGPEGEIVVNNALFPNDVRFLRVFSGWYWAFLNLDASNAVTETYPSRSLWDSEPRIDGALLEAAIRQPGVTIRANGTGAGDEAVRVGVRTILLPDRDEPVGIYVALDRRSADAAARTFLMWLAGALTALGVGLMLGAVVMVRFGLRPLTAIEDNLADIRAGRRDRLTGEHPRELAPLVRELNTLIDHNRKVVERARTHVGNLAHALKTPIAVLMNEMRGDDKASQLVRRQTEIMASNVNHYLKRAQAAAQAEVLGARSDVAPAVEDIARVLERLYQHKHLDVEVEADESAVFRGEKGDLDELVGNLMENAAKYCRSRMLVTVARHDGGVEIVVDDDGPGLSPGDRVKALERGRRLDESEPGTGLGLSIVTELAEIYGGALRLEDSPMGGLRARLDLPAAPL